MKNVDFNTIKKLHQAGNLDEAREEYLQFLKNNPTHVETLHSLAILNAQQEKFPEALEYIQTAIKLQPKNPVLYLHLANILKIQGLFKEAEEVLQQIITLDPNCISAYNNLGTLYYSQKKYSAAIKAYRIALEKQPDYIDAHYHLGLALIKNNQIAEAINHYEELLIHAPEHFAARFHLACSLMTQEQFARAEKHFLKIAESHPFHFETQTNLATCYLKLGSLITAKKHYLNALQLAQQDTQILYNLGVIETELDNMDSAIQYYQRAIQVNPDYFAAHNNLGALFILKQHASFALHHFQEALRLQPENAAIHYTVQALAKNQRLLAAPSDYITTLFDAYADHYDAHLVTALEYKVPELLHQAVSNVLTLPDTQWNILDLGCGTGLCGALFKSAAKTLTGVDLSSNMLAMAKNKNCYTDLIQSDLTSFLNNTKTQYDLILAGDVLVYQGDLQPLFTAVAKTLSPNGLFAFNAEINDDDNFKMNQSGRFSHSKQYIDTLAAKNKLKVLSYKTVVTRMQNNKPVYGHLYIIGL